MRRASGLRSQANSAALQFIEPTHLILSCTRYEHFREQMSEYRIVLAPSLPDQGRHRFVRCYLLAVTSSAPTLYKSAIKAESRNPFGMFHRVGNGHGAALRHSQ